MKPTSGASGSVRSGGYIALMLVLSLAAFALIGVVVTSDQVSSVQQQTWWDEEQKLSALSTALVAALRQTHTVLDPANWSSSIVNYAADDLRAALQVYPGFTNDLTTRRIILADRGLAGLAFPYVQSASGLRGAATNLATVAGRFMLISNTKRGLALPVNGGIARSAAAFNNIWNWTYNSSTMAPPPGWPAAWARQGKHLHVQRIKLSDYTHNLSVKNGKYTLSLGDGTVSPPITALLRTNVTLLDGTQVSVYRTNNLLYRSICLNADFAIDLSTSSNAAPGLWYSFSETNGSVARNSGSWGSRWNGLYSNSVSLAQAGPRSPTYPNYSTNNLAVRFDGVDDVIETGLKLTNQLPAFTMSAWIRPQAFSTSLRSLCGMRGSISFGVYQKPSGGNYVQFYTKQGGGSLNVIYPYPATEWHNLIGIANGSSTQFYLDGVLLKSLTKGVVNYFYDNGSPFRVGGDPSASFNGLVDEVTFYERALSINDLAPLANGQQP